MLDTTRSYLVENVSLQNLNAGPVPNPGASGPAPRRFEIRLVEVNGEGQVVENADRITINTTDSSNLPTVNDIVDASFALTL